MRVKYPVGRLIGGSLYEPRQKTDNLGNPVLDKEGKPVLQFNFGVAIPKKGETHWGFTEWGKLVWGEGVAAYDTMCQSHAFAWKITDGDSQIPDKNGKAPCQKANYPGNWVVWFTQAWAPRIVNPADNKDIIDKDAVMPGYFVQVLAEVVANGSRQKPAQSPGVYQNPLAVAFMGYGQRIISEAVDLTGVTFDTAEQLPGMSTTPPATFNPGFMPDAGAVMPGTPGMAPNPGVMPGPAIMPGVMPGPAAMPGYPGTAPMPGYPGTAAMPGVTPSGPGIPVSPGMAQMPGAMPGPAAMPGFGGGVPVGQPNTAILHPAPVVPAAPVKMLSPAAIAAGYTYDGLIAAGWNDAMMIQQGILLQQQ